MNPPCDFTRQRSGPVSSVCTKPHLLTPFCSFHRWAHLHRDFHHRPVDEETKVELLLREAPCSLSICLDLDHELLALLSSEHSREASLSCLTTPVAANSDSSRSYCNGIFSAAQITSEPVLEIDRRTGRAVGRSARGVSSWSSFCCLRFLSCRLVRRSTDRRWSSVFWPRATSPLTSRSPARSVRWAVSRSRPSAAEFPLRSFASRTWRLSCGAKEKK